MYVYKQFAKQGSKKIKDLKLSKDDQKLAKSKQFLDKQVVHPKRIQSLKQVFKGLGLSNAKLVVETNLKNYNDEDDSKKLTPCQEVDDEICAKILKHHGLAGYNCGESNNSLETLSEDESDNSSDCTISLKDDSQIKQGKLTNQQFKEIVSVIKQQCDCPNKDIKK